MGIRFFISALGVVLAGCSVYRSPERDSFDANGRARVEIVPLSTAEVAAMDPCSRVSAETLSEFFSAEHFELIRLHDADSASCVVTPSDGSPQVTFTFKSRPDLRL